MLTFHVMASLILAAFAIIWNLNFADGAYYLRKEEIKYGFTFFAQTFFTTICLNSTFIPVSLLVAIEMVKVAQAWFIGVDAEMFTEQENGTI